MSAPSTYEELATEEASPLTPAEREFADAALAGLEPEQAAKITESDLRFVVRGYQTYKPRLEETNKALKMIAEWRDKNNYDNFLKERLEHDEEFYKHWPEKMYGSDAMGHVVLGFQVGDINTEKLQEMDLEHVEKLVGQKLTIETKYKIEFAKEMGQQRYKHILVVNLAHTGVSLMSKGRFIKKLIDLAGDMFPETVWKIFVINTPFLLRGAWSMVKPWVHPITQAKVNILKNEKQALSAMMEIGIKEDAIPTWCGGSHEGIDVFDLLCAEIKKNQAAAAAEGAEAAPPPQATAPQTASL